MEKICIKNMGVKHSFEKMKLQLCFFKKHFSSCWAASMDTRFYLTKKDKKDFVLKTIYAMENHTF